MSRKPQLSDYWKQNLKPVTLGEHAALDLIRMTWSPAHADSDDSDRGNYVTSIVGTDFRISPPGGWHSMEIAAERAQKAYRVIADAIDLAISNDRPTRN